MTRTPFRSALDQLLDASSGPRALARFHDGELRVLRGEPYAARSGWTVFRESWLRGRLDEAVRASIPGYMVGISPPCDFPQGTSFYRSVIKAPKTFSTVFSHSNYVRFTAHLQGGLKDACIVSSGSGTHKVPPNGVVKAWDLDGLVTALLKEERTILVAAGPCACVIVHEYWKRQHPDRRQLILDVGAAIDPLVHGKNTRDFHDSSSGLRHHSCSWTNSVPWSATKKVRVRGWMAHKSGHKKYGRNKQ